MRRDEDTWRHEVPREVSRFHAMDVVPPMAQATGEKKNEGGKDQFGRMKSTGAVIGRRPFAVIDRQSFVPLSLLLLLLRARRMSPMRSTEMTDNGNSKQDKTTSNLISAFTLKICSTDTKEY